MRTAPRLRTTTAIGGWLLGAAAATGVSVLAVNTIGSGIANHGTQPLTSAEVARALSTAVPTTALPTISASASPSRAGGDQSGPPKVLTTSGGVIVAQCSSGQVTLLSWTPAQGFQADDVRRGPDTHADLEFKSDSSDIDVRVTCQGGSPDATTVRDTSNNG